MTGKPASPPVEVVLGNSNRRFSGVTSTMLQTMMLQREQINLRVLGAHHLPDPSLAIGFGDVVRESKRMARQGRRLVFHARRNDEMIQALILKHCLGAPLRIAFTSTAQRKHSGFTRWLMSKMDGVISTCQAAASYLKTPPDIIISHGVNPDTYHPATDRDEAWRQTGLPGQYGIGIFGRVRKQKGIELFVNACLDQLGTHPAFTAVIVGAITKDNAEFVQALKTRIADAGMADRIVFLGEQPFEKIPELIRAMSLIAALSYNEGFGLTVLEAMSSAVPVLATDAGAWPELVQPDINGVIVEAGDQQAVSEQLGRLLDNPTRLAEMGRAGRELVLTQYHIAQEADALCRYYRSLA